MKKALLLLLTLFIVKYSSAQLILNGTSYSEDFSSLANGLPAGWVVNTAASATALGTDVSVNKYYKTPVSWRVTFGEFRNSASANQYPYFASADSVAQLTASDRALAVRQVGNTSSSFPGSDPGAAFVLKIANTTGLTAFQLSFKLQSLDSTSPRITTWAVDYGMGNTPTTFTPATTTGTMTTGGNTYSNNNITVDFGNALDNQSDPVWIRIVALSATSGASNRVTTGIDDYNLTWTGIATGINDQKIKALPVNVISATNENIMVGFASEKNRNVTTQIFDITGRELFSRNYAVNAGDSYINIQPDYSLVTGMYFIRLSYDGFQGTAKMIIK